MTARITLVLEYPSTREVPALGPQVPLSAMGNPRITAVQFSDALRELEVLENAADEDTKMRAFHASYAYPGCDDPRRPKVE